MGILILVQVDAEDEAVHPHTHGDFLIVFIILSIIFGSPPHAWGF